jgi:hypothetical protein
MESIQEIGDELQGYAVRTDMHQYKLTIPKYLFENLQRLAARENTTVLDLIRRFIKLGLKIVEEQEEGSELIIRREDEEDEQILFLV